MPVQLCTSESKVKAEIVYHNRFLVLSVEDDFTKKICKHFCITSPLVAQIFAVRIDLKILSTKQETDVSTKTNTDDRCSDKTKNFFYHA